MTLQLYPSIDLRDGRVVRLRRGDYDDEIAYGHDAVDTAVGYCDQGATWIHVVDLDAARTGRAGNRELVAGICAATASRARIQVGGGVRRIDDAAALADLGVARVVMGSAAVAEPSLVDIVAGRMPVAVGLDHRNGVLAVHGWTETSGVTVVDALARFDAAAAFVITDIARDGLLGGPDLDGLAAAVRATTTPVIASGGVGSLDDVAALAALPGLGGIITGRALFEGRFDVVDALAEITRVVAGSDA
ncbi:1-(5-phosphoribosyl)-5-[(5-phosphoribosylamino)methylideneamino]imidazole-4-carboxamide isomerase [soil metagenome]